MTSNFEFSVYDKSQTWLDKDRLDLGLVRREKQRLGPARVGSAAPRSEPTTPA